MEEDVWDTVCGKLVVLLTQKYLVAGCLEVMALW